MLISGKIITGILTAAVMAAGSGTPTPDTEALLQKVNGTMSQVESMSVTTERQMDVAFDGEITSTIIQSEIDTIAKPFKANVDVVVIRNGEVAQRYGTYAVENGEDIDTYSEMEGKWVHEAETMAAVRELAEYYRGIFALLSSCAARQLEEVTFRRSVIPVSVLTEAAGNYFHKAVKNCRAAVTLTVETTDAQVVGDVDHLRFLLESLVDEALAWPAGGELRLAVVADGPFVRFSFTDTRRNRSQEELNQLFYPSLERMTSGEDGRLRGTEYLIGKQIIRDHDEYAGRRGCRIDAETAPDGRGFTVSFTIPRK